MATNLISREDDWRWFPSELRGSRERRGWSRSQFARMVEAPEKNVKNWEDGKSLPSLPYYGRICDVLGWPRHRPSSDPDTPGKLSRKERSANGPGQLVSLRRAA